MNPRRPSLLIASALLTSLVACRSGSPTHDHAPIVVPAADATKASQFPGLHNVVTYAGELVDGGQPEGDEGFATLAALGIKTVISVDGQQPEVELAKKHGLRYVHLPISYDTITKERQRELAQALTSCARPIYLHCHHGKHRSAAAMAVGLVQCGVLTPEQAKARMAVSGTAKEYTGLWQVVSAAQPTPLTERQIDPATLPSVTKVTGMVATMAGVDAVFDLVKQSHAAGWQAPSDHPDLIATKETGRLHALFASLRDDAESQRLPAEYQTMLGKAIAQTRDLDQAVQKQDRAAADALMASLGKSCKECHVQYRDR